jgi:ankyrin repeat protein
MNITSPSSALRTAAYNGDLVATRHLVVEGVDPNECDQWGRTALSLASGRGHLEVVQFLISSGALVDPYPEYSTFDTPLMAASEAGHLSVVKKLIECGADPRRHVGHAQATADFYARQNGHLSVHEYLSQFSK